MQINSTGEMQVITTPTFDWLAEQAMACKSRMLIGSPYVNDGITDLTNLVPGKVSRTLITRMDLRNFAVGASNLDTLCALAQDGIRIRSLSNLHAKIYIFDDKSALVTSANATFSGLYRNLECGIGLSDKPVVEQLADSLLTGFGTETSPSCPLKLDELESLQIPLKAIKASLPHQPREISEGDNPPTVDAEFSISDPKALLEGFSGWQKLTLRGVLAMPEEGFVLDELFNVCAPIAKEEYPNNRNVRPKLRQQLQMLRDLGLVEFVSLGRYRRTMS